jgi:hypothetical protein
MERYSALMAVAAGCLISLAMAVVWPGMAVAAVIFALLTIVGVHDLTQTRHSLLRNYPVIGHMRWLFEGIRPEIRQYLIESDQAANPDPWSISAPRGPRTSALLARANVSTTRAILG